MTAEVFFIKAQDLSDRTLRMMFESMEVSERIPKDSSVALKLHFGEIDNYTHIRPGLVKKLVNLLKGEGARPFLTDTNTLYRHQRSNTFDHLRTAAAHGFTAETMGCPIIIADGLRNWSRKVTLDSPYRLKEIEVALGIADADALVTLTHLTLHELIGLGGVVKNLGMGCVSRGTKLRCHAVEGATVRLNHNRCIVCGTCVEICPADAYEKVEDRIEYAPDKCIGCGDCIHYCPVKAISPRWDTPHGEVHKGIIDSARGVLQAMNGKPVFHLMVAMDVTLHCDCLSTSERIVPDIGILGSTDPIALDRASQDLLAEAPPSPGVAGAEGTDKLQTHRPKIDMEAYWNLCTGARIGTTDYQLQRMDPPRR